VGVTDPLPPIAIDRPLLRASGRDRSVSFAIDQKDLPIHREDFSPSIVIYRDLHVFLSTIMMPPIAHNLAPIGFGPESRVDAGAVARLKNHRLLGRHLYLGVDDACRRARTSTER
jgi:hypothetical protein